MTRRSALRHSLALGLTACSGQLEAKVGDSIDDRLRRIAELDQQGPALRAVIELNPDARSIAAELASKPALSALHGQAILIKDNIDTADAMHTTAGSLALLSSKPREDAAIVQRLREAGLVILGKTNLSEWANIRSPKSTSGWSARGGLTRNPHRLLFNTSGSSSGSAAAVAAGYTSLAIGTETNGSIVSPASACGIVGFKPTLGLVSQRGIIPITHHQDTAGPMTRTVREAAQLIKVISDPQVMKAHALSFSLPNEGLRGKRLGVLRSMAGSNPEVLAVFEEAVQAMRDAGATIVDPVTLPNQKECARASWMALFVELRMDLNAYLQARGGEVKSLAEVIAFNEQHREQEMPHFGQEFFEQADTMGSAHDIATAAEARKAAKQLAGPEGIDAALKEHRLDALICPTNDPIHRTDFTKGDTNGRGCSTPAAVAGYPHLTVPMGFTDDLPLGLSFMGTAWSDEQMLAMGLAFEQLMPAFREPKFSVD